MSNNKSLSSVSRILLVLASIALAVSIFVPIWKIELDAPQYPEGLKLQIYAFKLGGDVEIINGLNHYIGMKTLHAEEFVEFTVLPYILGAFALLALLSALISNVRYTIALLVAFALFGILAMVDFWRWEYDYGHNLDPNAAIIVPGMAYQPPLIGFKQLLNFGAYSVPDLGGWLMLAAGLLIAFVVIMDTGLLNRFIKKNQAFASLLLLVSMVACNKSGPVPVNLNKDDCAYCQMTISDARFASQLITEKGRVYKFDDITCMIKYAKEENQINAAMYVSDYNNANAFLEADKAIYMSGEALKSPMRGNIAAFASQNDADEMMNKMALSQIGWEQIRN